MSIDRKQTGTELSSLKPAVVKVLVVGLQESGKSKLCKRIVKNEYDNEYEATIGAEFHMHKLLDTIPLHVWDIAGDDRYAFFLPERAKDCHIAVLCIDSQRTMEKQKETLKERIQAIKTAAPDATLFYIVTKVDPELEKEKSKVIIDMAEVRKFVNAPVVADSKDSKKVDENNEHIVFECSAKTGKGLEANSAFITQLAEAAKKKSNANAVHGVSLTTKKINLFIMFYTALRDAQSKAGWRKTDFLTTLRRAGSGDQAYAMIEEHAKDKSTRSAMALTLVNECINAKYDLTKLHENMTVIKRIHDWGFKESSIFKKSNTFSGPQFCQTLFRASTVTALHKSNHEAPKRLKDISPDTRTGKIITALKPK